MKKGTRFPRLGGAAILFAALTASAHAGAAFMPTSGVTTQPVGHYEFCKRLPEECSQKSRQVRPVELTHKLWAKIVEINNTVNTSVMPRTDMEQWGIEEYWSYPDIYGDCEDYVVEKRRRLMQAGVPDSNLLMTVVRRPNGDGHAVLTINTHMGDYVLDNMELRVLPWAETRYQYLKRQSARNSGRWVGIQDSRHDLLVGSVSSQ